MLPIQIKRDKNPLKYTSLFQEYVSAEFIPCPGFTIFLTTSKRRERVIYYFLFSGGSKIAELGALASRPFRLYDKHRMSIYII